MANDKISNGCIHCNGFSAEIIKNNQDKLRLERELELLTKRFLLDCAYAGLRVIAFKAVCYE
jgi:hypothetical protein